MNNGCYNTMEALCRKDTAAIEFVSLLVIVTDSCGLCTTDRKQSIYTERQTHTEMTTYGYSTTILYIM